MTRRGDHGRMIRAAGGVLWRPGSGGTAVVLVRNGRAVPARRWAGGEGDRPLDFTGREQAKAVRRTLPAFGPSRLLSACGARFAETLRPLGAELRLTVEDEPALGEDQYAAHPGRGLTRIRELAGAASTTVVCASGVVIRHLLATLAEDAGLALSECPARKGSAWALFSADGELAAADYYPALTSPRP